jgi:hypothetical protein
MATGLISQGLRHRQPGQGLGLLDGLPAVERVGVRAGALVLVQQRNVPEVGRRQLEVEDVDVLPRFGPG